MPRTTCFFASAVLALVSTAAGALEVDFTARVANAVIDEPDPGNPRVVAVAVVQDRGLQALGSITYHVNLRNVSTDTEVFDGFATITSTDMTVDTGNANTGRITLTYDPVTDVIEVRFAKRVQFGGQRYAVSLSDDVNWFGSAEIITNVVL